MICGKCAYENRPDSRFCAGCGAPLAKRCTACDRELQPDAAFCDFCGVPVAADAPEVPRQPDPVAVRKTVTALFCDLVGSTAFGEKVDPEAARESMNRYFAMVRTAIEDNGGVVAKFIGDGVMAMWGVPEVSEDDAERAVRAGLDLQDAFAGIRDFVQERHGVALGLRVGINTGEVVISDDDDDVVGDALNTAARLEAACTPGRVLVGEPTWRLSRGVVDYTDHGVIQAKGKEEPVASYEVVGILELDDPHTATPFVGREAELRRLQVVMDEAILERAARLVTVIGSPGVGKTRLAREMREAVEGGTRAFGLRCEREGTATFAPMADLLRSAAGITDANSIVEMQEHLRALVDPLEDADRIAGLLAGFVGAAPMQSTEELFLAARRLFEVLGATQPVVLVVDDIQWAEPLFLDLLEHLAEWVRDVPLMIVCLARPEIRDVRPPITEPSRRVSAVVALEGLDTAATHELAARLVGADSLPADLLAKIPESTQGNPLFVRELMRMLVDDGVIAERDGRWEMVIDVDAVEVPPTVNTLLASRVERLETDERQALEFASVVGSDFPVGAVAAAAGDVSGLHATFERLRRKELIEPTGTYWGDEPVFRFHHVLIRDAAYRRLLKGNRAELHVTIGDWTERTAADLVGEHEVTVAHHFEQAYLLRLQLGIDDAETGALGTRAAGLLRIAANRALDREDLAAAGSLAARALACVDDDADGLDELLLTACEALLGTGNVAAGVEAVDRLDAVAADDRRLRAWVECFRAEVAIYTDPGALQGVVESADRAADVLAELDDQAGVAKARLQRAAALVRLGRVGDCEAELDAALTAARAADDRRRVTAVLGSAPIAALWGPSPVPRAGGRCLDVVRLLRITTGSPAVEATSIRCQAVLESLRGRHDTARTMLDTARSTLEEIGHDHGLMETSFFAGLVELLADDPAAAEPHLRRAHDGLGRLGIGADAGQAAAYLARSLLLQDRLDEAEDYALRSDALAGQNPQTAIVSRSVQAEILAARGDVAEALTLADEAVHLAAGTDILVDHANAVAAQARVRAAAGDATGAAEAAAAAASLYEQKGATVEVGVAAASPGPDEPDESTEPAGPGENRCAQLVRSMMASYSDGRVERDWYVEGVDFTDRRRVIASGSHDLDSVIEVSEMLLSEHGGLSVELSTLRTAGDHCALMRVVVSLASGQVHEWLSVNRIDERGRFTDVVIHEVDALDEAAAELDRLHTGPVVEERATPALEPSFASSPEWMVTFEKMRDAHEHMTAGRVDEWAAFLSDEFVWVERRPGMQLEAVGREVARETLTTILHNPDEDEDEAAHVPRRADEEPPSVTMTPIDGRGRNLALARVLTTGGGTSQFEREYLLLGQIDNDDDLGLLAMAFDVGDLASATAELDRLAAEGAGGSSPHPPSEAWNIADRVTRRSRHYVVNSLVDEWRSVSAPDLVVRDRRSGALQDSVGRDLVEHAFFDARDTPVEAVADAETIAVRGETLVLQAVRVRIAGDGGAAWELLGVSRIDASHRVDLDVLFDVDQLDAATRELDRLYEQTLAPADRIRFRWLVTTTTDLLNTEGQEALLASALGGALAPDYVMEDLRVLGRGLETPANRTERFAADRQLVASMRQTNERIIAVDAHGVVIQVRQASETKAGASTDSRVIRSIEVSPDGQLLQRMLTHSVDDVDAAVDAHRTLVDARSYRPDSLATAAAARINGAFRVDAPELSGLVAGGVDLASAPHAFGLTERRPVAIRGDVLAMFEVTRADGTRAWSVEEFDSEGRLVDWQVFGSGDILGAADHLDDRWFDVASGLTEQDRLGFAFVRAHRHQDMEAFDELMSDDFVLTDHRPLGLPQLDREALFAAFDAVADQRGAMISVEPLAAAESVSFGRIVIVDAEDGQPIERLAGIGLVASRDGRITSTEFFAEDDLAGAMARFDDLASARVISIAERQARWSAGEYRRSLADGLRSTAALAATDNRTLSHQSLVHRAFTADQFSSALETFPHDGEIDLEIAATSGARFVALRTRFRYANGFETGRHHVLRFTVDGSWDLQVIGETEADALAALDELEAEERLSADIRNTASMVLERDLTDGQDIDVYAVRGDEHALAEIWSTPDDAQLHVVTVDVGGNVTQRAAFAVDDLASAIEALEQRYVEGLGDAAPEGIETFARASVAYNRMDPETFPELFADDMTTEFHTTLASGGGTALLAVSESFDTVGFQTSYNAGVDTIVAKINAIADHCVLITAHNSERRAPGDRWVTASTTVATEHDGRFTHIGAWDVDDLPSALARYTELSETDRPSGGDRTLELRNAATDRYAAAGHSGRIEAVHLDALALIEDRDGYVLATLDAAGELAVERMPDRSAGYARVMALSAELDSGFDQRLLGELGAATLAHDRDRLEALFSPNFTADMSRLDGTFPSFDKSELIDLIVSGDGFGLQAAVRKGIAWAEGVWCGWMTTSSDTDVARDDVVVIRWDDTHITHQIHYRMDQLDEALAEVDEATSGRVQSIAERRVRWVMEGLDRSVDEGVDRMVSALAEDGESLNRRSGLANRRSASEFIEAQGQGELEQVTSLGFELLDTSRARLVSVKTRMLYDNGFESVRFDVIRVRVDGTWDLQLTCDTETEVAEALEELEAEERLSPDIANTASMVLERDLADGQRIDVYAVRGDLHALAEIWTTQADAELHLVTVDIGGNVTERETFLLDDLPLALGRLDGRYLRGLGDAAPKGSDVWAATAAALNPPDPDAFAALYADDIVLENHTPLGSLTTGSGADHAIAQNAGYNAERDTISAKLHAHADHAVVGTIHNSTRRAAGGRWIESQLTVAAERAGKVTYLGTWPPEALDQVLARFEELASGGPMSLAESHFRSAAAAFERSVEEGARHSFEMKSPDVKVIDRRRGSASTEERFTTDPGSDWYEHVRMELIATRGARLTVCRTRAIYSGGFESERFDVARWSVDGAWELVVHLDSEAEALAVLDELEIEELRSLDLRNTATMAYDADHPGARVEAVGFDHLALVEVDDGFVVVRSEIDGSYTTDRFPGRAAAYRRLQALRGAHDIGVDNSPSNEASAAVLDRDVDRLAGVLAPGFAIDASRLDGTFPSLDRDELLQLIGAGTEFDVEDHLRKALALADGVFLGWMTSISDDQLLRDFLQVGTWSGSRLTGTTVYPLDRLDEALAHFDRLASSETRSPAERTRDEMLERLAAHDLDGYMSFVADEIVWEDRRASLQMELGKAGVRENIAAIVGILDGMAEDGGTPTSIEATTIVTRPEVLAHRTSLESADSGVVSHFAGHYREGRLVHAIAVDTEQQALEAMAELVQAEMRTPDLTNAATRLLDASGHQAFGVHAVRVDNLAVVELETGFATVVAHNDGQLELRAHDTYLDAELDMVLTSVPGGGPLQDAIDFGPVIEYGRARTEQDREALERILLPDFVVRSHRELAIPETTRAEHIEYEVSGREFEIEERTPKAYAVAPGLALVWGKGITKGPSPTTSDSIALIQWTSAGIRRQEEFGLEQLDQALERFDELAAAPDEENTASGRVPLNTAARAAIRRDHALFAEPNEDEWLATLAEDVVADERLSLLPRTLRGRNEVQREYRGIVRGGLDLEVETLVLGTRGDDLALCQTRVFEADAGRTDTDVFLDFVNLSQTNADGQTIRSITFEVADEAEAWRELGRWWADTMPPVQRLIQLEEVRRSQLFSELRYDEWRAGLHPDYVSEDRRQLGFGTIDREGMEARNAALMADVESAIVRFPMAQRLGHGVRLARLEADLVRSSGAPARIELLYSDNNDLVNGGTRRNLQFDIDAVHEARAAAVELLEEQRRSVAFTEAVVVGGVASGRARESHELFVEMLANEFDATLLDSRSVDRARTERGDVRPGDLGFGDVDRSVVCNDGGVGLFRVDAPGDSSWLSLECVSDGRVASVRQFSLANLQTAVDLFDDLSTAQYRGRQHELAMLGLQMRRTMHRRDIESMERLLSADFAVTDRRRLMFGTLDRAQYLRVLGDLAELPAPINVGEVLASSDRAWLWRGYQAILDEDGWTDTNRGLIIMTLSDDRISGLEAFDETDLSAAEARFDELSAGSAAGTAPPLVAAIEAALSVGDLDAFAAHFAEDPDFQNHLTLSAVRGGKAELIQNVETLREHEWTGELIVAAGENAAVYRIRAELPNDNELEWCLFVTVNDDGLIDRWHVRELTDLRLAFVDASAFQPESPVFRLMDAINLRDEDAFLDYFTADSQVRDHRPGGLLEGLDGDSWRELQIDSMRAYPDSALWGNLIDRDGDVVFGDITRWTDPAEPAEWHFLTVQRLVGNRLQLFEAYALEDHAAARARFDELAARPE